jgi:hypothetical protein
MAGGIVNPLSAAEIENMKVTLLDTERAIAQLDLAKKAGIDVTSLEAELLSSRDQLKKLIAVYGSLPTDH